MSHSSFSAVALLAAAVFAIPASSRALGIPSSGGNVVNRPTNDGIELSGITWAGGNTFYAVNDTNATNKLYKLSMPLNSNGEISSCSIVSSVTLANSSDLEGCAYDPATGNVWVSMEGNNSSIREYDPQTGALLRTAPLPVIFQNNMRGNFKLEALTISGDGLTMWTANEEALTCDGQISAKPRSTGGTIVRLQKFTRASVRDNWIASAQYAYKTYGLNKAYGYKNTQRSGVAGLCALPNGQLLVLEREFSGTDDNSNLDSIWVGTSCSFTMAIVLADYSNASDVSTLPSLSQATYTPVSKTSLCNDSGSNTGSNTGFANYEGICLGPRNSDGSVSLLLISDGGGNSMVKKTVMSKKLMDINVRTLYVDGAPDSEPVGGPYRHVDGTTVTATLPSVENPYEPATRVHAAWQAPANNASGEGASASFAITADDTLTWSTVTDSSLPLLATDSFERLPAGTEAPDIAGWSGDGYVAEATYAAPVPAGYPLGDETHTAVLVVDGDVERDYADIPGDGSMVDVMVRVTRESADSQVADAEGQIALFFDAQGRATLQHKTPNGSTRLRTALSSRTFANGDWVRVSFLLDYSTGTHWCQIRLDGEPCVTDAGVRSPADPVSPGSWYRTLDASATKVSSLLLRGTGAVDDVAFYDAAGALEFDDSATTNGVPYVWLTENGLPWDPALDADGDGYDARAEYAVGTDPLDDEDFFRIVDTGFDANGRFQVRFLGTASTSAFLVYASDDLSLPESEWTVATGTITRGADGLNVWTQTGDPGNARFFRVRITLPEDTQL